MKGEASFEKVQQFAKSMGKKRVRAPTSAEVNKGYTLSGKRGKSQYGMGLFHRGVEDGWTTFGRGSQSTISVTGLLHQVEFTGRAGNNEWTELVTDSLAVKRPRMHGRHE